MIRTNTKKQPKSNKSAKSAGGNPFQARKADDAGRARWPQIHIYLKGAVCATDKRGHRTPRGRSPLEIVVDASEGFVPLWARGMTLRWRFQERSMTFFQNPVTAKAEITNLLGEALLAWGDAAPVKFAQHSDAWDFEIVMRRADDCDINGCVLASAFFPDAGRHELTLYPQMFEQSRQEQVETLIHEIGHVFGLRHFFADVSETAWPSQVFGTHSPFSIMNYGSKSVLTDEEKGDLRRLYRLAWSGELTNINGTPVRLFKPFHTVGGFQDDMVAVGQLPTVFQPQSRARYVYGT